MSDSRGARSNREAGSDQETSQERPEERATLTYAQWLTTPTHITADSAHAYDRVPMPWFTAEARSPEDQRIRWVTLSEVGLDAQMESTSLLGSPAVQDSCDSADVRRDQEEAVSDEAVAGHYLDRVEEVQARDQARDQKRDRRNTKKREQKKSSGSRQRKNARQNASSNTAPSNTAPSNTASSNTASPQRGGSQGEKSGVTRKRRGRRGKKKRGDSKEPKSS